MNEKPGIMARAIFQPMNRTITVPSGTPLLDALRSAGVAIESICGGKGTCRKCKVALTKGTCETHIQTGGHCHVAPQLRVTRERVAFPVPGSGKQCFPIPRRCDLCLAPRRPT
jgi:uncharacterized 2Fe-2S/4Fe-4S cluster protein (DUF4445 family)